jgi:hypothetical protein
MPKSRAHEDRLPEITTREGLREARETIPPEALERFCDLQRQFLDHFRDDGLRQELENALKLMEVTVSGDSSGQSN